MPNTKRCWKQSHSKAVLRSLENEVLSVIGNRVITTITTDDIDSIIDPIVKRGALEVSERTLSRMNAIFRYGIYKGWTSSNLSLGKNEFLPTQLLAMKFLSLDQIPLKLHLLIKILSGVLIIMPHTLMRERLIHKSGLITWWK